MNRSNWIRIIALWWGCFFFGPLTAQTPTSVDLEVRATISPGTYIPPGTSAVVDVTLINHGPDTALLPEVTTTWMLARFPPAGFRITGATSPQPCEYSDMHIDPLPGDPMPVSIQLDAPPLAPGQSITCQLRVESISLIEYGYTLGLSALDGRGGFWRAGSSDPDSSNNRVDFQLRFTTLPEALAQPEVIPATSPAALWGLVMLLVTSAGVMFWRRR